MVRILKHNLDNQDLTAAKRKAANSVRSLFIKEMTQCFPWFNVNTARLWELNQHLPKGMLPNACLPPSDEHTYAQWLERDDTLKSPQPSPFKKIAGPPRPLRTVSMASFDDDNHSSTLSLAGREGDDLRKCMLCQVFGDALPNHAGRLLYMGQDDWIHANCALWSAEVYEDDNGNLLNVWSAYKRGKNLVCDLCRRRGATVGCCWGGCNSNYHFMCARNAECAFQEDKRVFCVNHVSCRDRPLVSHENFFIQRRACVEFEGEKFIKKTWLNGLHPLTLTIVVGSMTLESLGELTPLSDHRNVLYPVGYSVTRIFWSTTNARRRTVYTCRILEVRPNVANGNDDVMKDMTVSHDAKHPSYDHELHLKFTSKKGAEVSKDTSLSPSKQIQDLHVSLKNEASLDKNETDNSKEVTPAPAVEKPKLTVVKPPPVSRKSSIDLSVLSPTTRQMLSGSPLLNQAMKAPLSGAQVPDMDDLALTQMVQRLNSAAAMNKISQPRAHRASSLEPTGAPVNNIAKSGDRLARASSLEPVRGPGLNAGSFSASNLDRNATSGRVTPVLEDARSKMTDVAMDTSIPEESNLQNHVAVPYMRNNRMIGKRVTSDGMTLATSTVRPSSGQKSQPINTPDRKRPVLVTERVLDVVEGQQDVVEGQQDVVEGQQEAPAGEVNGDEDISEMDCIPGQLDGVDDPHPQRVTRSTRASRSSADAGEGSSSGKPEADNATTLKWPFKCPQCKRLYRTQESCTRHSKTCNFLVSSEEEEEEEEDLAAEVQASQEESNEAAAEPKVVGKESGVVRDTDPIVRLEKLPFTTKTLSQIVKGTGPLPHNVRFSHKEVQPNLPARSATTSKATNEDVAGDVIVLSDSDDDDDMKRAPMMSPTARLPRQNNTSKDMMPEKISNICKDVTEGGGVPAGDQVKKSLIRVPPGSLSNELRKQGVPEHSIAGLIEAYNAGKSEESIELKNANGKVKVIRIMFPGVSNKKPQESKANKNPTKPANEESTSTDNEVDKTVSSGEPLATPTTQPSSQDVVQQPVAAPETLQSTVFSPQMNAAGMSQMNATGMSTFITPVVQGQYQVMQPIIQPILQSVLAAPQLVAVQAPPLLATASPIIGTAPMQIALSMPQAMQMTPVVTDQSAKVSSPALLLPSTGQDVSNSPTEPIELTDDEEEGKEDLPSTLDTQATMPTTTVHQSVVMTTEMTTLSTAAESPVQGHSSSGAPVTSTTTVASTSPENQGGDQRSGQTADLPGSKKMMANLEGTGSVNQDDLVSSTSDDLPALPDSTVIEAGEVNSNKELSGTQEVASPSTIATTASTDLPARSGVSTGAVTEVFEVLQGREESMVVDDTQSNEMTSDATEQEEASVSPPPALIKSPMSALQELKPGDKIEPSVFLQMAAAAAAGKPGQSSHAHGIVKITHVEKPTQQKQTFFSANTTGLSPQPSRQEAKPFSLTSIFQGSRPIPMTSMAPRSVMGTRPVTTTVPRYAIGKRPVHTVPDSIIRIRPSSIASTGTSVGTRPHSSLSVRPAPMATTSMPGSSMAGRSGNMPATTSGLKSILGEETIQPGSSNRIIRRLKDGSLVTSQIVTYKGQQFYQVKKPSGKPGCSYLTPTGNNVVMKMKSSPSPDHKLPVQSVQHPKIPMVSYQTSPQLPHASHTQPSPAITRPRLTHQLISRSPKKIMAGQGQSHLQQSLSILQPAGGVGGAKEPSLLERIESVGKASSNSRFVKDLDGNLIDISQITHIEGQSIVSPTLDDSGSLVAKSSSGKQLQFVIHKPPLTKKNIPPLTPGADSEAFYASLYTEKLVAEAHKIQKQRMEEEEKRKMEMMLKDVSEHAYVPSSLQAEIANPFKKRRSKFSNKIQAIKLKYQEAQQQTLSAKKKRVQQKLGPGRELVNRIKFTDKNGVVHSRGIKPTKNLEKLRKAGLMSAKKFPVNEDDDLEPEWTPVLKSSKYSAKRKQMLDEESSRHKARFRTHKRFKKENIPPGPDDNLASRSHPMIHSTTKTAILPQPALEEEVEAQPLSAMFDEDPSRRHRGPDAPRLVFEISSEDGFKVQADTWEDAWKSVTDKVQDARANARLKHLSFSGLNGLAMFGLNHDAIVYFIEQLYGANRCHNYRFRYHRNQTQFEEEIEENDTGAARSEPFSTRKPFDIFSFLMSKYRMPPDRDAGKEEKDSSMVKHSQRRVTCVGLPMAMRFRGLRTYAKEAVAVYRSPIHGRGLFCMRDIEASEMVIEYAGEIIRSTLTDKREKYYESKGIGCYMFRMDDEDVIDATIRGNAARFINHCCEPNCYSKVINVDGVKHIVIFAIHAIKRGEELTYDYKFPYEEIKIPCTCTAKKCRRYLN